MDVRSQQLIILPDEDIVYTELPAQVDKGSSRMNGVGMHYNNKTRMLQVSASTGVEISPAERRRRQQDASGPAPDQKTSPKKSP